MQVERGFDGDCGRGLGGGLIRAMERLMFRFGAGQRRITRHERARDILPT